MFGLEDRGMGREMKKMNGVLVGVEEGLEVLEGMGDEEKM